MEYLKDRKDKNFERFKCQFPLTNCHEDMRDFEKFLLHMLRHVEPISCNEITSTGCNIKFAFFDSMKGHLDLDHQIDLYGIDVFMKNKFANLRGKNTKKFKTYSDLLVINKFEAWLLELMNEYNSENDM